MTDAGLYRVQLLRTRGWRKPDDVVVVARPTKWGNPVTKASAVAAGYHEVVDTETGRPRLRTPAEMCDLLAGVFESWLVLGPKSEWWLDSTADRWNTIRRDVWQLRGKRLACWCPVQYRCHADTLWALANDQPLSISG